MSHSAMADGVVSSIMRMTFARRDGSATSGAVDAGMAQCATDPQPFGYRQSAMAELLHGFEFVVGYPPLCGRAIGLRPRP